MAKEFLVFDTLGGCTLAPQSKAGWLERFSHMSNYLALSKASNFTDFFKGNTVGPGSPDDPIWAVF